MTPGDAAAQLRRWYQQHLRAVLGALAWYGVPSADRPDLAQEVFWAAYVAALRVDRVIEDPRAWLREFARKHARNYRRKALRRSAAAAKEVTGDMATPEHLFGDRELLILLFEEIESDAQGIILDVRASGMTWEEVAQERGISVDRVRYLYRAAVEQMERALQRWKAAPDRRDKALLLLSGADLVEAEPLAFDVSPEVRRRIWESLERRMDAAGSRPEEAERERESAPRVSPISIQIHPQPSMALVPALGILGGGIAIGLVLGLLLHDRLTGSRPLPQDPSTPTPALARNGSTRPARDVLAVTDDWGDTRPEAPERDSRAAPAPAAPARERAHESSRGSPLPSQEALLDWAGAALDAGDTPEALAKLAEHARRFKGGPGARARQQLSRRACGAVEAPDCVGLTAVE